MSLCDSVSAGRDAEALVNTMKSMERSHCRLTADKIEGRAGAHVLFSSSSTLTDNVTRSTMNKSMTDKAREANELQLSKLRLQHNIPGFGNGYGIFINVFQTLEKCTTDLAQPRINPVK